MEVQDEQERMARLAGDASDGHGAGADRSDHS